MPLNIIDIEIESLQINISGAISLKLKVSDDFEYIGNQEINIYDNAKAFHYIFASYNIHQRREKCISKLFFLQYEYYLSEVEKSYNYESSDIIEFGGILWQNDNFIDRTMYNDWKPNSDVFQLITFLEKKKFAFPQMVLTNRLVTMLDEKKNQELLILYVEEITMDKWKKLFLNDKLIDHQWQKEKIDLKKRSLSAFSIL